jgi:hypothetical protein
MSHLIIGNPYFLLHGIDPSHVPSFANATTRYLHGELSLGETTGAVKNDTKTSLLFKQFEGYLATLYPAYSARFTQLNREINRLAEQEQERIEACTQALMSELRETKPMPYIEALKISLFVNKLMYLSIDQPQYFNRSAELPRAVIFNYADRAFVLLSEENGKLYGEGTCKSVKQAMRFTFSQDGQKPQIQGKKFVHITYYNMFPKEREQEVQIARWVNDDIYLTIEHVNNKGNKVLSVIEEEYECNLDVLTKTKIYLSLKYFSLCKWLQKQLNECTTRATFTLM